MTAPTFATAEGLRLLLLDLAYAGRGAVRVPRSGGL